MRAERPVVFAALLLVVTACGAAPGTGAPAGVVSDPPRPPDCTVTIDRVVDGDTLALVGGERVRLLTVDSPELNIPTKADDAECGAEAARDALVGLLPPGTRVDLAGLPGEPDRDRYGRTLANAYVLPAGAAEPVNVSLWLVQHGWARAYLQYRTVETGEAIELEAGARDQGRGMWASCPQIR